MASAGDDALVLLARAATARLMEIAKSPRGRQAIEAEIRRRGRTQEGPRT